MNRDTKRHPEYLFEMSHPPIIRINNLVKDYYGKKAVNGITLKIPESCFALLGPNGAGKTTTILMLLGLIRPTNGNAFIFEKDISTRSSEYQLNIGYLPENVGFYPNLTGWDHLDFYARLRIRSPEKSNKPARFLEWCGLEQEYWHKKVKTYSRGMKQRLGLAQAFIGNPKIVFLDEPLSNIDPLGREDLVRKIRQKRKEGVNIVISSHIIQEIEQIADIITIINKGKILANENLLNLALQNDFHEFEVRNDASGGDNALKPIFKELNTNQHLFLDNPVLLSDRIILKTQSVVELIKIMNNFNTSCYIKPIDGTLLKIYKKIMSKEIK